MFFNFEQCKFVKQSQASFKNSLGADAHPSFRLRLVKNSAGVEKREKLLAARINYRTRCTCRTYCALMKRRHFIAALTMKLLVYFCLSSE